MKTFKKCPGCGNDLSLDAIGCWCGWKDFDDKKEPGKLLEELVSAWDAWWYANNDLREIDDERFPAALEAARRHLGKEKPNFSSQNVTK